MQVKRTIFRDLTILPVDDVRPVVRGDLVLEKNRIAQVGGSASSNMWDDVLDGSAMVAIPGLVQAHIHLTQTLFRNRADDLELMEWLRTRIWPFEAAHDEKSSRASARLGLADVNGGTTSILRPWRSRKAGSPSVLSIPKPPSWRRTWCRRQTRTRFPRSVGPPCAQWSTW